MMGGKTNIMDEPRMPPLTEPTTPMSSKRDVRKAMKASNSAEMRRTPTGEVEYGHERERERGGT